MDFGFAPSPHETPLLVFFRTSVLKNTLENTELFYKKPPESSCMLIKEKNEEPLKVLVKKWQQESYNQKINSDTNMKGRLKQQIWEFWEQKIVWNPSERKLTELIQWTINPHC